MIWGSENVSEQENNIRSSDLEQMIPTPETEEAPEDKEITE